MGLTLERHDVEELYRKYGSLVLRRALQILKNEDEARDVMQEVFIKVIGHYDSFRHDASPSTWLYRITTNLCLNKIRDRKPTAEASELNIGSAPNADPGAALEVARLLSRLPKELSDVAVYHYLDGMSPDEIAKVMGLSRRAISHRLARFREEAARLSQ